VAEDRPGDTDLVYLTIEDVLTLHGLVIGVSSTEAADQLRNRGGLESALTRSAAYAHYENADLAHQATALAHGIAEGQQFIDGNKRTALVAMLTFLEVNGLGVSASDRELADSILSFSAGATPEEVALLVRPKTYRVD
jgi:death on curing protein